MNVKQLLVLEGDVQKSTTESKNISPHLWESTALWNRFWRLVLRVEVGRKDRLPRLLATTSVDIKRHRFSFAETRRCAALADCLSVDLLQLSHY